MSHQTNRQLAEAGEKLHAKYWIFGSVCCRSFVHENYESKYNEEFVSTLWLSRSAKISKGQYK